MADGEVFPASDSEVEPPVDKERSRRNIPAAELVQRRCLCTNGRCFQQFAGREAEITKTRESFQALPAFRKDSDLS